MVSASKRVPAVGFIFVTYVFVVLGFGVLIPVLPRLVTQFRGGDLSDGSHTYGLLVGTFALMQFLVAPALGALSDRIGRRPVILLSLAGSALDYLIMAYAPNLAWLFAARAISGALSGCIAAANAYLADVTPPERRAQNFGLLGAAFGLGLVLGPALGGFLGQINLRLPFFVAAGLAGLNWLYGAFVLPESLPRERRRAFAWKRANPVGALLALRQFANVLPLAGAHLLAMAAQFSVHSTWVLYTQSRYGWNPRAVGLSLAVVGTAGMLVQGGLVRWLAPRLGERRCIVLGLAISVASLTAFGSASAGWMVYALIPLGALANIAPPALQGLVSRGVPATEQGALQGALAGLGSLAGVIAPPAAAWIFGYGIDPAHAWKLPGAAFFGAAVLQLVGLLLVWRTTRGVASDPAAAESGK
ncbi:MAG: TCR/Tet family MFS transporter [Opitutaceae bacterium]